MLVHGHALSTTSPIVITVSPPRIRAQSMPLIVRFSPAPPATIGCPWCTRKSLDDVAAVQADRLPGSAMVSAVALHVAEHTSRARSRRPRPMPWAPLRRRPAANRCRPSVRTRRPRGRIRRKFVETGRVHRAMGGHHDVAVVELDGELGGSGDERLVRAFQHITDQVVAVGKRPFEVVAAPARSIEPQSLQVSVVMADPSRRWCRSYRG